MILVASVQPDEHFDPALAGTLCSGSPVRLRGDKSPLSSTDFLITRVGMSAAFKA